MKNLFNILAIALVFLFLAVVGLDLYFNKGSRSISFYFAAVSFSLILVYYVLTKKK